MKHFALKQADINDLLQLITSPNLTITANNAARLHQLQASLSREPIECDECNALRLELHAERLRVTDAEADARLIDALTKERDQLADRLDVLELEEPRK